VGHVPSNLFKPKSPRNVIQGMFGEKSQRIELQENSSFTCVHCRKNIFRLAWDWESLWTHYGKSTAIFMPLTLLWLFLNLYPQALQAGK